MKAVRVIMLFLAGLLLAAGTAAAQNHDKDIEQSGEQFKEIMGSMGDYVKDVTFDEDDIKSMIAHWQEMNALDDGDDGAMDEEEEGINFHELAAYPEYRSWAQSRGFDPDDWLKKIVRIQGMVMKGAMSEGALEGRVQLEAQMAGLEAQRAQMGEEAYQQMKQAMETGAAVFENMESAYKDFPEPTASEKDLIERYREQIMNLE